MKLDYCCLRKSFDVLNSHKHCFIHSSFKMNLSRAGTKNAINACRECKVKRLLYHSSADVVFDGSHDIYKSTESVPCPSKACCILAVEASHVFI